MTRMKTRTYRNSAGKIVTETVALTEAENSQRDSDEEMARYEMRVEWSGHGELGDQVYEMESNGEKKATLNITKWDKAKDSPARVGSESFWVCVIVGTVNPSVGKVTLVDGVGAVDFTPPTNTKGMNTVIFDKSSGDFNIRGKFFLGLV